jgi:glycosyltransferase involved in cell wall biosynthesis
VVEKVRILQPFSEWSIPVAATTTLGEPLRVCVVAESASFRFGGEASLPLHYFTRLRARGVEAWLIVHSRTREELKELFPDDMDRIQFLPDKWFHKATWKLTAYMPRRVFDATLGMLVLLINQYVQRRMVCDLIAIHQINIVHQPMPVSPRSPSFMCKLGVPVIIGPMNGGMEYPPAFRNVESWWTRVSVALGRRSATLINRLIPGKKLANVLLVANERTRRALPLCTTGEVIEVPENGVDLGLWTMRDSGASCHSRADGEHRFLFVGRLVDWKRVDITLHALAAIPGAQLDVIGDGPMQAEWTELAGKLNVSDRVSFLGWRPQVECAARLQSATALLLPSVYECGGAVVLEAMSTGTPVIATAWGGPEDYIDETCGILVSPISEEGMIQGFRSAMQTLINEPELRCKLGAAARQKIEDNFDWENKLDRVLAIYQSALERTAASVPR